MCQRGMRGGIMEEIFNVATVMVTTTNQFDFRNSR